MQTLSEGHTGNHPSKSIPVEVVFSLAREFDANPVVAEVAGYSLTPQAATDGKGYDLHLTFASPLDSEVRVCNPDTEVELLRSFLSLVLNSRLELRSLRIAGADFPGNGANDQSSRIRHHTPTDLSEVPGLLSGLLALDLETGRQVLRASRAYSTGLQALRTDATLAFFLLTVAIECLSSQDKIISFEELHPDRKKCERFCQFIRRFLPPEFKGEDEQNPDLMTELLKNIYYTHRSGFVHGGTEVSKACHLADEIGSSYFRNVVKGSDTKTPGIIWFANVVRGSILGFLTSGASLAAAGSVGPSVIQAVAREMSTLTLIAAGPIAAGTLVTTKHVHCR